MIGLNNWAIIALCKHIIANNSLACAGVAVGVDEPMCYRVVITGLEVIEPCFGWVLLCTQWGGEFLPSGTIPFQEVT